VHKLCILGSDKRLTVSTRPVPEGHNAATRLGGVNMYTPLLDRVLICQTCHGACIQDSDFIPVVQLICCAVAPL